MIERIPALLDAATEKVRDVPEWANESKGWAACTFKKKISSAESHLLYWAARTLGPGNYADIGVYRGFSTACFAHGLQDGLHRGTVYAVDLFEERSADPNASDNLRTPETLQRYWERFEPNIQLELCVGDSSSWGWSLDVPFKFVFLDADHSYLGCLRDYEAWERLVVPGGMLAFHDTNFNTVDHVIQEIQPPWHFLRQIYSTKLFIRMATK